MKTLPAAPRLPPVEILLMLSQDRIEAIHEQYVKDCVAHGFAVHEFLSESWNAGSAEGSR